MNPTRRSTIQGLAASALAGCGLLGPDRTERPMKSDPSGRMPVLFVGHGSPMNAIEDNQWRRGFEALGADVPRPRAILAISAHWFVDGTYLTGESRPKTIHDFGGFPQALFEIEYPAPGRPELAQQVLDRLEQPGAALSTEWGLDHGTWCVVRPMYPAADVPVVQLSLNRRLPLERHLALGQALAPLRDEGVLILGSGNVVHNLRDAFGRYRSGNTEVPAWAGGFDRDVATALEQRDHAALVGALPAGEHGRAAHPSIDHYLPLLYAAGAALPSDAVSYPIEGFDMGSISMRTVRFG